MHVFTAQSCTGGWVTMSVKKNRDDKVLPVHYKLVMDPNLDSGHYSPGATGSNAHRVEAAT